MGTFMSAIQEIFPPPPKFTAESVPDLDGQLFLITGGNNGIGAQHTSSSVLSKPLSAFPLRFQRFIRLSLVGVGKETAKVLLQHNAKVYIACRSLDRAKEAAEDLKRITGKTDSELAILQLDLADFASIKTAVDEYLRSVYFVMLSSREDNAIYTPSARRND